LVTAIHEVVLVAGLSYETRFAVAALATWRMSHLVAHEDGPAGLVVRLRAHAGDAPLGSLLDCFFCLSIWVAAPFALATARGRRDVISTWLALSGAACLLERATSEPVEHDGGRTADGLLWQEAASA
jgi:hypothetical protein